MISDMMKEFPALFEESMQEFIPTAGMRTPVIDEAMRYSLFAGGKRLRPMLMAAAYEAFSGEPWEQSQLVRAFMTALEMIHTYSLIHDDLPAMDNDDLRRGKKTNHIVFGAGMATLAGDGLLNAAAEIMARAALERTDQRGLRAMEAILRHAGVTGMIAGQVYDLEAEGRKPSQEELKRIHAHKTADLLQAPMEAGLALAGASEETLADGLAYGYHFGMAFQMVDDLLDVIGDASLLGKKTGMDAEMNKMTWVTLRGVEGTREDARREAEAAAAAAERMKPLDSAFFVQLATDTLNRVQ